ncbi:hypothetical protein [Clostridium sp. CF012]|uniref:hypothetical protein n=1 Tax=Clostridium sp. CF012 TaxID=2843319 RepID=UPI001C0B7626|nr:hypothetical protein [Clostridium sp. CF012]MBU3143866.1 hypothetical protein [Clostridium sp. CF012]
MGKKNRVVLCLFLPLLLMLISCSNNRTLNLSINKGDFSKSKSEVVTSKYEIKSTDGFFSRIDFDLNEGKVDWEITGPKGEAVFKGYASNENGKTYRQLTYPPNFSGWQLTEKLEILPDKNSENGINNNPDFGYLQFDSGSPLGIYTLSLKPKNAEGKYTVMWSDGIMKK